jgi:transcriptional regulator with XRE-family HTH domain
MVDPKEILETHVPTATELALLVKSLRGESKWSQATLAEISGLNERTIQRVENGEPSTLDTRRALARAFKLDDLDIFNKPWPFPNVEKLKAYSAELEKTTVQIPLTRITDGRTLRLMVEGTSSFATDEIGGHSELARETFAGIVDYLTDYNDIQDCYSMTQRLGVDRDIDAMLKTIAEENAVVGAGIRRVKLRFKTAAPDSEPMDWTNIYFVIAPRDTLPSSVRVPKAVSFG